MIFSPHSNGGCKFLHQNKGFYKLLFPYRKPEIAFASQDELGSTGFQTSLILFKCIFETQNLGLSDVATSERPQA